MKFPMHPELPTASIGSSPAPTAAVDNSAPSAIRPDSTYKSGKVVQTTGATSGRRLHGESSTSTKLCPTVPASHIALVRRERESP